MVTDTDACSVRPNRTDFPTDSRTKHDLFRFPMSNIGPHVLGVISRKRNCKPRQFGTKAGLYRFLKHLTMAVQAGPTGWQSTTVA